MRSRIGPNETLGKFALFPPHFVSIVIIHDRSCGAEFRYNYLLENMLSDSCELQHAITSACLVNEVWNLRSVPGLAPGF